MIKTFACRDTESVWNGVRAKGFPPDIQDRALRKLRQINAAVAVDDLRNPPGNRLELLKGDRKGLMSIRINGQYRICFTWIDNDAYDVEIVDYH